MRGQFVTTVESLLTEDSRIVLLLGDIGVFGFRNAFRNALMRVYNIGILEQSTISVAAGLAQTGIIPIVHTIAPFLVERALEQLKIDFGYQRLGGNFVSVGASYEYAALGCTHHCPGDVAVLKSIPNMEIAIPGTSSEFDALFRQAYANGNPTYFRLAERENPYGFDVTFGKAEVLETGKLATVIAVGPVLGAVKKAVQKMDVSLIYYTTIRPFDSDTLRRHSSSEKIIICEPYYKGGLAADVCRAVSPRPVSLMNIGVPHKFLTNYGKREEHDVEIGFTEEKIRESIHEFIHKKTY